MRLAIRRPTVASSPASWQRACRIRAHRRGCTFSSTTTRAPCSGSSWRKPGSRGTGTAEQLALLLRTVGLGEVAHAFLVLPLRVRVLHRREQLRVEALRHVHTRHDDTGDLTLLDLVVDAREGDRELVLREGDVREVRIRAGHLLGVEMDVELALLTFAVHVPQRYYGRGNRHPAPARVRGHGAGGRGRRWDDRLPPLPPRAVVAVLLPRDGVRVADRTRHGPEKRRCAFADDLHGARGNHYLCLRRLAGRRSDRERGNRRSLGGTEEAENDRAAARPLHQLRVRSCRAAGGWGVAACRRAVRRLGLQPRCDRRRARGRGAVHRGQRHRRRRSRTCRARARAGARRRVRRRRRQSLHHALGSCSEPESADRLAGGRVMANLVLKPQVTAFVDVVTSGTGADLRFEEIEVTDECRQGGKTIRDLDLRKQTGALVVALRKRDGTFDTTPTPEATVEVGDVLIAAGTTEELTALEEIFAPREALAG